MCTVFVGRLKEMDQDNINVIKVEGCGLDSSGSGQGPMLASHEESDVGPSGSVNCWEFFDCTQLYVVGGHSLGMAAEGS
jgi:hypothetical protein